MAGHDYLTASRLDGAGIAYVLVAGTWTALLLGGIAVFLFHRKLDFVRMRNPLLVTTALVLIHVYLCLMLLLYPLNASYGCNAGFWMMSVYFPLGIACWHTANIHVLNLSHLQEELISETKLLCRRAPGPKLCLESWRSWLRQSSLVARTTFAVALYFFFQVRTLELSITTIVDMIFRQVIASIVVFLASRKFHASYGLWAHAVSPVACRTGWEW